MVQFSTIGAGARVVFVAAAALALAACGKGEEPVYEADATDASGGELIVTDPSDPGVPVDLPTTPMTNVPAPAPGAEPTG